MNESLPILSLAVSIGTVLLLVPLYGKVFFSRHSVEYRPIEEIAALRQSLGIEKEDQMRAVEQEARETVSRMFGMPVEDNSGLTFFQPERPLRKEKSPADMHPHEGEARANTETRRMNGVYRNS